MNTDDYLQHFLPYIKDLPEPNQLQRSDLIHPNFLIEKNGNLEMYFSPHNEFINSGAKLVIVGITPGWTQMKRAFQEAKQQLGEGASLDNIIKSSKLVARFAGPMRKHLIEMLDTCGVHEIFGLRSCHLLFDHACDLLHTTSVIKYPVFIKGKNYTGYSPKIEQSTLLKTYAYGAFPEELKKIKSKFLLVPLGKRVSAVISKLVENGEIPGDYCLFGFPHPSGANGHRLKQFAEAKDHLQSIVRAYSRQK
ncbi:hypothetical protein JOD43_002540 [Pullulanibacillus pueri]|uniref:Uracil DNA glycosylase superfamily protein n=1 Tax=Pullulanibacillus pueri TaxID=1437324 RepID=A0A8J2ZVQ3_9BACL|nr:hypothetical protein [Pullulanibacillus pueri]MBM7682365.1 hypothetical protein [Pullulanibacillus pueri]GGH80634.1 hypothetical protein GCM10007096_17330 [Pullulanibacillus pueri]